MIKEKKILKDHADLLPEVIYPWPGMGYFLVIKKYLSAVWNSQLVYTTKKGTFSRPALEKVPFFVV